MRPRQPKSWILLISLCCALLYGALQYSPHDISLTDEKIETQKQFPQSYTVGIVDRTYNKTGALEHTMVARSVASFTEGASNRSEVDHPHVTLYGQSSTEPWQLSAKQGTSRGNIITLQDSVQAWNEQGQYGWVKLTTDTLSIDTEQQYAHTNKPVTMRSERGTTRAVGLSAELDNGRIELLSEVKATYAP